jgi:hypothetical protein
MPSLTRATLLAAGLLALAPAAASATVYVDDDTGSDSRPCTKAMPCATLERGVEAAVRGERVLVDGGSYAPATTITLSLGRGLVATEFTGDREASTEIESSADPAIRIDDADGREVVRGFRLRSAGTTIETVGPVTISGNAFEIGGADGSTRGVFVTTNDPIAIEDNSFAGTGATVGEDGVVVDATDTPNTAYPELAIEGNEFAALRSAVRVLHSGMGMPIRHNRINGTHPGDAADGVAILIGAGSAEVCNNRISGSSGISMAIVVVDLDASYSPSVRARFNRIRGFGTGILAQNLFHGLDSYGDVFFDNGTAVVAQADEYGNRVSLDHATFWGNDLDVELTSSGLDVDHSILEHPIAASGAQAFCFIYRSRGPTTSGGECERFTTAADPGFVDAAAGNLHLRRSSAMVDAGGRQFWVPLGRRFDFESDSRFADGDGDGECQPDIGADEFAVGGVKVDCVPPETRFKRHSGRRVERGDRVTLRFTGRDDRPRSLPVRFQCRLDQRRWRRCTSPQRFRFRRLGQHLFQVRALDAAGNHDLSPARRRIKVVPCRTRCAR